MVATSLGLTLMVPNFAAVAALLVLVVAVRLQVCAVEEPYLLAPHADGYRRYAARVGRFVPLLADPLTPRPSPHRRQIQAVPAGVKGGRRPSRSNAA